MLVTLHRANSTNVLFAHAHGHGMWMCMNMHISRHVTCSRAVCGSPLSPPGVSLARSVHAVDPPSGRCASPPGPPRSPLGSSGPHARALQPLSSDRSVKTPTFAFPALQPGARRKAQKSDSKTLNMDLICSDRAQDGLALSGPIAGGTVEAAASVDKVL